MLTNKHRISRNKGFKIKTCIQGNGQKEHGNAALCTPPPENYVTSPASYMNKYETIDVDEGLMVAPRVMLRGFLHCDFPSFENRPQHWG